MQESEKTNKKNNFNVVNEVNGSSSNPGNRTLEDNNTSLTIELPLEKGVVANIIKAIRELKSYSQTRLGRVMGVQKSQISKLEKGENNISLSTMVKVFKALKVKVGFKVELEKETETKKLKEILHNQEQANKNNDS